MDELWLWRPEDTGPEVDDHILEELCARLAPRRRSTRAGSRSMSVTAR
jgi:hypothetical protein